jgi:hypothetical protein
VTSLKELRSPIVIAAFEGWSDAADAASGAVSHLGIALETEPEAAIDPDDYYDFQVNRPVMRGDYLDDMGIVWPTTRLSTGVIPGANADLLLIHGVEPNMRWRAFTEDLVNSVRSARPCVVITLGALLADSPHTRPVPVTTTVNNSLSAARFNAEHSAAPGMSGSVGIATYFAWTVAQCGMESILLWGSVPHYVSESPSPKVTLALLHEIQNLLAINLPLGDLPEEARAWEQSVDELAAQDAEVLEYVRSLEAAR